jgi:hypothetical protein
MKRFASISTLFVMAATFAFAGSWTGRLVDASCKVSNEGSDSSMASCPVTAATNLFAIELPDAKVLILDAAGSEKAADAMKHIQKTDLHATVTGSLDGQTVKVDKIEIQ